MRRPTTKHDSVTHSGRYKLVRYTAVSGHRVQRLERLSSRLADATARCRDERWNLSESRRGTCLHHSGVASRL